MQIFERFDEATFPPPHIVGNEQHNPDFDDIGAGMSSIGDSNDDLFEPDFK